jgi:hypothetical protein
LFRVADPVAAAGTPSLSCLNRRNSGSDSLYFRKIFNWHGRWGAQASAGGGLCAAAFTDGSRPWKKTDGTLIVIWVCASAAIDPDQP